MSTLNTIADFAALVPRITGSISVLSSSMIIFLIYRSQAKLSTIYHRIMFGMSFADIMSSTAMALTTIPMPRNDAQYWIEQYGGDVKWEGYTKIGNWYSCQAQGFFYSTGVSVMFAYNASLCAYYACAIALRMQEKLIRKKVAPFLLGLPPVLGLAASIPAVVNRWYNVISNEVWCTLYPVRKDMNYKSLTQMFQFALLASITFLFVIIIVSFALVIWRVRQNGKLLAQASNRDHIQVEERVTAAHQNTKLVIAQSLAYIGGFLLSLLFPFLRNFMYVLNNQIWKSETKALFVTVVLGKMMLVFMPLQGFFNFIIFLWHKGREKLDTIL